MNIDARFEQSFGTISDLIALHAGQRPNHPALILNQRRLSYAALNALIDQVASALQRDGLQIGDTLAICAATSIEYVTVFFGAVRIGVAVAPLAPTSTAHSLLAMAEDAGAKLFFIDAAVARDLRPGADHLDIPIIALDDAPYGTSFSDWLPPAGSRPAAAEIDPELPFNVIYSSGTTGAPKGIVQSHQMRWLHVQRGAMSGYGPQAVTLLATPLYSNTTLVSFLPALALGGTLVLMLKFEAGAYLALAQQHRATHTMLVPVQYQRLMAHADLDNYDLSSFQRKFCTSAPFSTALKSDILARWPGGLTEYYGMTEGGGTCILDAREHPDKLHTVGCPAPGHDIRVIDEQGTELAAGNVGEVVGHSMAMMNAYHNRALETEQAEWYDASGKRFIRTGDIGRFDADGFLTLLDRKKDMIISGGFNVYPSDLEAVLLGHPDLVEVAVVGVTSAQWGETPVAFAVLRPAHRTSAQELLAWANQRLGKTQRLSGVDIVKELPRSTIGKVLKRELRDRYQTQHVPIQAS